MSARTAEKILFIDTSGPSLQLALAGAGLSASFVEDIARGHAEILFDRLAGFLAGNETSYKDLTRVGVTTGPGSFTGLRIGISAARGLSLALDIPAIGVPNLLALSLCGPKNPHVVIVAARREQAYVQQFSAPGQPRGGPELLALTVAEKFLPAENFSVLKDPLLDIVRTAQFALEAKEDDFPPHPSYVRAADAKPQTKMRIARK
ncbi:tRNA threonylcarbamoyladenosine biosynthesis protein TsaB [hydrothermal vent metagenome]|uniref:tRNA threonylcarbamoyladenosine biosynthesis protein TsaB n=1 Tax=hydrothermal vent metagenome TaxID=652676 RepID=A0A3B0TQT2_9ZZZZ